MSRRLLYSMVVWFLFVSTMACRGVSAITPNAQNTPSAAVSVLGREVVIPEDAVKMSPKVDDHPPLMRSPDFEKPVPVQESVNTAGAEDSPFILPDGNTLYFFFTPDVDIPVKEQVLDGVTGIYMSEIVSGEWDEPEFI